MNDQSETRNELTKHGYLLSPAGSIICPICQCLCSYDTMFHSMICGSCGQPLSRRPEQGEPSITKCTCWLGTTATHGDSLKREQCAVHGVREQRDKLLIALQHSEAALLAGDELANNIRGNGALSATVKLAEKFLELRKP